MNYKKYALVTLLLTPQVGMSDPIPYNATVRPSLSRASKAKPAGWFASKWETVKDSVSSAFSSDSETLSSAETLFEKAKRTLCSYPKVCATTSGIISYFLIKPLVQKYVEWDSEQKSIYTAFLVTLIGSSIFGLRYMKKMPNFSSKIVASFIAGLGATGLVDQLLACHDNQETT